MMNDWEQKRELSRLKKEIEKINDQIELNMLAIAGIKAEIKALRKNGDVASKGVWLQKYTTSKTYKYYKLCIERKGVKFDLIHISPKNLERWEKAIERRNTIDNLWRKRNKIKDILKTLQSELYLLEGKILKIQPTRKSNAEH